MAENQRSKPIASGQTTDVPTHKDVEKRRPWRLKTVAVVLALVVLGFVLGVIASFALISLPGD